MANPEHLAKLREGPEAWNRWRKEHADVVPDLNGADLSAANLVNADFNGANLREAKLTMANLSGANLKLAKLRALGIHRMGVRASLGTAHIPS
jgi:uncharacterized protein YjbI with pentapeptide repeats